MSMDMIYEGSPVTIPEPEPKQHVCSLIKKTPQTIKPYTYTLVRFPYGESESYDPENMHAETVGTQTFPYPESPESALIRPAHTAWGTLSAMLQWETGAKEYRDKFVRDPLGTPDWTATEHRPPSPGEQCFVKMWGLWVYPDVPLGLWVTHTASTSLEMTFAEFKLAYRTD